jgi:hypothetical protein
MHKNFPMVRMVLRPRALSRYGSGDGVRDRVNGGDKAAGVRVRRQRISGARFGVNRKRADARSSIILRVPIISIIYYVAYVGNSHYYNAVIPWDCYTSLIV